MVIGMGILISFKGFREQYIPLQITGFLDSSVVFEKKKTFWELYLFLSQVKGGGGGDAYWVGSDGQSFSVTGLPVNCHLWLAVLYYANPYPIIYYGNIFDLCPLFLERNQGVKRACWYIRGDLQLRQEEKSIPPNPACRH